MNAHDISDAPALELIAATGHGKGTADIPLAESSLSLPRGGLALLHIDGDHELPPFVDLILGLIPPVSGRVLVDGHDWQALDAFDQGEYRGRFGVVFEASCWMSNLSLRENITLRLEHHTHQPVAELLNEADAKAAMLGMGPIAEGRPESMSIRELRLLEWVRAFMGRPQVVLLVCPERGAPSWAVPRLHALVQPAVEQGTAVLWVTDRQPPGIDAPGGTRHYRIHDNAIIPKDSEGDHE